MIAENDYTRRKELFHPDWGARFKPVRHAVFDWPLKYIESSDGATSCTIWRPFRANSEG